MIVNQIFKTPHSETNWAMHMNDANLNWSVIYTIPFEVSLSTKLKYFQFQFLHEYLPLNKFLFDINIVDSKLCSFCKQKDARPSLGGVEGLTPPPPIHKNSRQTEAAVGK